VSASELRDPLPADLVAAALTQQSPRMAARAKFSRADVMYFTRDALEPASSELTAGDLAGHWRLRNPGETARQQRQASTIRRRGSSSGAARRIWTSRSCRSEVGSTPSSSRRAVRRA